jgi:capsular exopolysaccharide synthesis family protein
MSKSRLDKNLVSLTAAGSFAAEQYQGLRLTIERLRRSRDMRVIAISSPGAGDGKTVTSINLAGSLARGSDARVLLVDADLRRPAIGSRLGLKDIEGKGLADAITDARTTLQDVIRNIDQYNLSVVTSGCSSLPIHQILRSSRLEPLLQEARQSYDYIVLDTPPLIPVFDAAVLAKLVDGLLIVVAANRTPRKLLAEALNLLDPQKVLGIVFNSDERPLFGYYESYYKQYFPEVAGAAR